MANIPGLIISEVAGATLVKGEAVVYSASNTVVKAGADKALVSVVTEDAASGSVVAIQVNGLTTVKLGGTVAAGAELSTNASGLFITATTGPVVGRARKAGVSGELIEALIG